MAKKANSYISAELDLAEQQLARWKKYLLDNPYDEVEDRKELMKTKTGGAYYAVVQTKEAIQKSLRDTMKEYLAMCEVVERLREKEEAKKEVRGGGDVPHRMKNNGTDDNN
jgi:hypothetical protein